MIYKLNSENDKYYLHDIITQKDIILNLYELEKFLINNNMLIICEDAKKYLKIFKDPRIFIANFFCLKSIYFLLNESFNKELNFNDLLNLLKKRQIEELC